MQHRTIGDLMTRPVVHVRTDATCKAVAATLAHDDVTAVPVVDDIGRPVGVVSEADLVRGVAQRPDPAGPTRLPEPTDRSPGENVTVEELMTAPAVCARRSGPLWRPRGSWSPRESNAFPWSTRQSVSSVSSAVATWHSRSTTGTSWASSRRPSMVTWPSSTSTVMSAGARPAFEPGRRETSPPAGSRRGAGTPEGGNRTGPWGHPRLSRSHDRRRRRGTANRWSTRGRSSPAAPFCSPAR